MKPRRKFKCPVDSDNLLKHFENILGGNPPDICEEVLNLLENDQFLMIFILTHLIPKYPKTKFYLRLND